MILNVVTVYLKLICLGVVRVVVEEICQDRSLSRGLVQRTFPVRKRGREEVGRGVFQIFQRQIGSLVIFDVFFYMTLIEIDWILHVYRVWFPIECKAECDFVSQELEKKSAWKLGIIKIHKATNESVLCTSKNGKVLSKMD